MRELLIILQREFWERVRSRSFIISTILTPLFFFGFTLGPVLLAQRDDGRDMRLIIIDESGDGMGAYVAERLREGNPAGGGGLQVSVGPGPLASLSDSLASLVQSGRLDAYVYIPAGMGAGRSTTIWSADPIRGGDRSRIRSALSQAAQEARAGELGLEERDVQQLLSPVALEEVLLNGGGEESQSEIRLAAGFAGSFILYMLIVIYGVHVLRSVQEEKANRISEILVSSVSPGHLMLGKVLGVGSTALLQVAIWVAMVSGLTMTPLLGLLGASGAERNQLLRAIPLDGVAVFLVFLVLGFFLFATLFAALGAAAETMEDAQRFTMPLTMPLLIPMLMSERIISGPEETISVVLSWIPFTAPLVMPMRVFAGGVHWVELVASVVWVLLSIAAIGWIAGRIYRAGILNTGKRHGWRDIGRWVRAR